MRKASFALVIFILGAGILASGCKRGARQEITLMLDWFPNPDHAPIYVALQKGFFERRGLKIELQVPANPNDPLKLVAAGKVDLAISYEPQVIISRSQGLSVTSIGVLIAQPLSAIMYLKDSGITSAEDLKGKRIGYSVSGFEEAIIHAVTKTAGLSPDDYESINVNFNIVPSLLTGAVDAVAGAYRNYEKIQMELEGKKVGLILPEENGVPTYYELVVVANSRKIPLMREKFKAFIEALQEGIRYTVDHPKEAQEIFFSRNPDAENELNRKALFATLPYFAVSQYQDEGTWRDFQEFLFDQGVIEKKTDVSLLYRNL